MARSTQEIYDSLVEQREQYIPEINSTSQAAEWRLWLWIFAYGIHLFEVILDITKSDVEQKLNNKQPGSLEWYIDMAKQFQLGYSMSVNEKGVLSYPVVDSSAQIIKHASVTEQGGGIILKVAKYDNNGNLAPLSLTNVEFLQFQRYIENIKFAGTDITVTTLPADLITYSITVYYDPAYLPDSVKQSVIERLKVFRLELSFDGVFYTSDFVQAILQVVGVKTVKVNTMTGTQGEATQVIDVSYAVAAGYFNFDENSVITMQNAKQ